MLISRFWASANCKKTGVLFDDTLAKLQNQPVIVVAYRNDIELKRLPKYPRFGLFLVEKP